MGNKVDMGEKLDMGEKMVMPDLSLPIKLIFIISTYTILVLSIWITAQYVPITFL
jgi:hypothetical protein